MRKKLTQEYINRKLKTVNRKELRKGTSLEKRLTKFRRRTSKFVRRRRV
jgi:hypothetical protein